MSESFASQQPRQERPASAAEQLEKKIALCLKLKQLLRENIRDFERPISVKAIGMIEIVSQASEAVFKKHGKNAPVLEVNGTKVQRMSVQKKAIASGLDALGKGRVPLFFEMIKLDPELFFERCELEMNHKRNTARHPDRIEIPQSVRDEITSSVDEVLALAQRKPYRRL